MFKEITRVFLGIDDGSQKGPSLDNQLAQADAHLENFDSLILPAPESMPRTPFDNDVPLRETSLFKTTAKQKLELIKTIVPLQLNMRSGASMYDGKFKPTKSEASPEFITELEEMAFEMGAKDIGYVQVPPNAIFKEKGIPCEYAIVFTVEMDKEPIETAPSFDCFIEVANGYKNLAVIAKKMAKHIRENGFEAYPGTALGGLTDYPYLAEMAGLGVIGYHGLLISPGQGARLRINTIYTNITNLPTMEATGAENDHLWVRDFCDMCRKCIRSCPVEAIFEEPVPRGDGGMQTIDHGTCRDYFARNHGCAICLAICPFSHTGYDKIHSKFKGNPTAPQFRIPVTAITER